MIFHDIRRSWKTMVQPLVNNSQRSADIMEIDYAAKSHLHSTRLPTDSV